METREKDVFQIYRKAVGLDDSHRQSYLSQACGGDADLRAEVEQCLASSPAAHFFTNALTRAKEDWASNRQAAQNPKPGDYVGKFKIIKPLGEGGSATVFLARQTEPERNVALKLLKGCGDRGLDRFEIEQHVLARMEHPYVAKIFESGVTENGRPFFVMEHISGLPITEYCRTKNLSLRDQLELIIKVCEGVQYAHRNGVIHRDLKPSNILVAEVDGKPAPRIIDFGIARALENDAPFPAVDGQGNRNQGLTGAFTIMGSPGYMSPEQTRLTGQDSDTRTDVYALGILLFEILTGAPPFDFSQTQSLDQIFRVICRQQPPKPSMALQVQNPNNPMSRTLRGDLDIIVMKALEKNRDRRYDSPSLLALDLNRYLNRMPILARSPGILYKARRLVQRNKATSLAVLFVILALGLGAGAASLGLLKARKAEKAALRDAANAASTLKVLEQILTSPDPAKQGRDIRVEDLLMTFSPELDGPDIQPEIKAALHHLFSKTLLNLGSYEKAHEHALKAVDLRTELLGGQDPQTIDTSMVLVSCLSEMDDLAGSEKLCRELLARSEAQKDWRRKGQLLNLLSEILRERGDYEQAISVARTSLAMHQTRFGEADPGRHTAMNHLANTLYTLGQYEEMEQLRIETLNWRESQYGERHPQTLIAMNNYVYALRAQRKFGKAESIGKRVLALSQEVYGQHPKTALAAENLGMIYYYTKRFEQAEPFLKQAYQQIRTHYGPKHRHSMISANNLSMLLMETGDFDQAETLYREVLTAIDPNLSEYSEIQVSAMHNLAYALQQQGELEAAEQEERMALEISTRVFGETHPKTLTYMDFLARLLKTAGWLEEAADQYEKALDLHRCRFGDNHAWTLETQKGYLDVLRQLGREETAAAILRDWKPLAAEQGTESQ